MKFNNFISMISENLITIVLNYLKFNKQNKFLDLRSYHLDNSNSRITFENFKSNLPLAIGIHLSDFKNEYTTSLTHIQKLNMCECYINILPKELFDLKQLKIINCSQNNITIIPAEIENCKTLQEFYCDYNKITVIPT